MKAIKLQGDDLICRYEDAIYMDDDSCFLLSGGYQKGYLIGKAGSVEDLIDSEPNGWATFSPALSSSNREFEVLAGNSSYGRGGFIALKHLNSNSFKWVIHLSYWNNPINLKIANEMISITSDLDNRKGAILRIPILNPNGFKTESK